MTSDNVRALIAQLQKLRTDIRFSFAEGGYEVKDCERRAYEFIREHGDELDAALAREPREGAALAALPPLDTIPCTCLAPEHANQEHEESCPRELARRKRAADGARETWHAISSAPKDGRYVLLAENSWPRGEEGQFVTMGRWFQHEGSGGEWVRYGVGNIAAERLTHWMDLPKLPITRSSPQEK